MGGLSWLFLCRLKKEGLEFCGLLGSGGSNKSVKVRIWTHLSRLAHVWRYIFWFSVSGIGLVPFKIQGLLSVYTLFFCICFGWMIDQDVYPTLDRPDHLHPFESFVLFLQPWDAFLASPDDGSILLQYVTATSSNDL